MTSITKKLMLLAVVGGLLNVGACTMKVDNPELAKFADTAEGRAAKAKYLETNSRYVTVMVPFGLGSW